MLLLNPGAKILLISEKPAKVTYLFFVDDEHTSRQSGYGQHYIGAFNLSITAHDILNQTRSLSHTVAANYVEDSYRLVLGRYILFGVKWNFGKMNAVHSQRAQDAAWNMLW